MTETPFRHTSNDPVAGDQQELIEEMNAEVGQDDAPRVGSPLHPSSPHIDPGVSPHPAAAEGNGHSPSPVPIDPLPPG